MKSKWSFVSVPVVNCTNRAHPLLVICFFPLSILDSSFSPFFFYSLFLSIFLSSYLFHQTYVYCGDFIPVLLNRLIVVNCSALSLYCNWNFNRSENYKIARFFVKKISLKNFILICMCVWIYIYAYAGKSFGITLVIQDVDKRVLKVFFRGNEFLKNFFKF